MTALIPIALYGWPLVMLVLGVWLRSRKAVLYGTVAGWLVLPVANLPTQGFIDIDKRAAISLGTLALVGLLDWGRLRRLRPALVDLPILLWCGCGLPTSLVNGLGLYDGLASSLRLFLHWGVPWFLGRLYANDLEGLRLLCKAVFVGGLAYAPLCLWEVRMSPTLHGDLYGVSVYEGISYAEELGSWGSRPAVFLANPLELGLFLTTACLGGIALAWQRTRERLFGLRASWLLASLLLVSLACKNLGATLLLLAGVAVVYFARRRRSLLLLQALTLLLPLYALGRTSGAWGGAEVVQLAGAVHQRKAESFAFRLRNEDILIEKALERPLLGWGGWGRARVYNEKGEDISVTDGLWVIALGTYGLWGLGLLVTTFLAPVVVGTSRLRGSVLRHDLALPVLVAMTLITLLAVDSIANNFPSPLILIAAGGVAGLPPTRVSPARRRAAKQRGPRAAEAVAPHHP